MLWIFDFVISGQSGAQALKTLGTDEKNAEWGSSGGQKGCRQKVGQEFMKAIHESRLVACHAQIWNYFVQSKRTKNTDWCKSRDQKSLVNIPS